jgi:hypothetical protein
VFIALSFVCFAAAVAAVAVGAVVVVTVAISQAADYRHTRNSSGAISSTLTVEMSYDRVVVGLTTTPSRVEKLGPALAALAAQTRMPDAVYVSVPEFSTCENKEYDRQAIDAALARALGGEDAIGHVVILGEDYGPLCKLIGMILVEPCRLGTLLITVDDDRRSDPTLVETLLDGASRHAGCAVCLGGHTAGSLPFSWGFRTPRQGYRGLAGMLYLQPDSRVTVVSGWCGCAYPRIMFKMMDQELETLRKPGLTTRLPGLHENDDVYISSWLYRLGVPKIVIAYDKNAKKQNHKTTTPPPADAASPRDKSRAPARILQSSMEWRQLARSMQAMGLLESPSEEAQFPWYKSLVFDSVAGGTALGLVVVLAAVGGGWAIYSRASASAETERATPRDAI